MILFYFTDTRKEQGVGKIWCFDDRNLSVKLPSIFPHTEDNPIACKYSAIDRIDRDTFVSTGLDGEDYGELVMWSLDGTIKYRGRTNATSCITHGDVPLV